MKHWKLIATAVGLVAATTTLGACTSGGGGGDVAGAAYSGAGDAVAGPAAQASSAASAPSAGSAGGNRAPTTAGDVDLALGTSKIRTVELSVTAKKGTTVAAQADSAEAIVAAAGGEVDADQRSSGRYATATLVLKVPPEQLAGVLTRLSALGKETARHRTTTDVTAKVADVSSRVASARDAIARLRGLYAQTTKVADVIAVESELSQRESDLESLEAQQRALAAETSLATVTLELSTPVVAPPHKKAMKPHHVSGFVGGLKAGWDAFAHGAGAVATAAGAVLPFAVLVVVLLVGVRLLWPRLRPAPKVATGAPTE